jgi:hypothetical protein
MWHDMAWTGDPHLPRQQPPQLSLFLCFTEPPRTGTAQLAGVVLVRQEERGHLPQHGLGRVPIAATSPGGLDVRLLNIDRHAGNILVKNLTTSDNDPFKDAEMLRTELPSLKEPAVWMLTLCTIFLKRAAAARLCLADIGDTMTREVSAMEEGMSAREALCKECHDSVHPRLPTLPPPSPDGDGVSEGATFPGARTTTAPSPCGARRATARARMPPPPPPGQAPRASVGRI